MAAGWTSSSRLATCGEAALCLPLASETETEYGAHRRHTVALETSVGCLRGWWAGVAEPERSAAKLALRTALEGTDRGIFGLQKAQVSHLS